MKFFKATEKGLGNRKLLLKVMMMETGRKGKIFWKSNSPLMATKAVDSKPGQPHKSESSSYCQQDGEGEEI